MGSPTRTTAFGLDVWSRSPPEVLMGARASATGRRLELAVLAREPDISVPPGARLLSIQRGIDDKVVFLIEQCQKRGYVLRGERYGEHRISLGGGRLCCLPGAALPVDWQRFLIAQVLPFAAVQQGLEVLHASAVELDGRAIVILGPSAAGKSSLALALCELGAGFLADDVVAVETCGESLIAHPGSPLVWLGREEEERMCRVRGAAASAPVAAIMCLERSPDGPSRPSFESVGDSRLLLSSTFNLVVREEHRLRRLLDVCALAARGRVERVCAGPGVDVATLARVVIDRLGTRAGSGRQHR